MSAFTKVLHVSSQSTRIRRFDAGTTTLKREKTMKSKMSDQIKGYCLFSELHLKSQQQAIKNDRLFSSKFGYKRNTNKIMNNWLYHPNEKVACMTVQDRKNWYL